MVEDIKADDLLPLPNLQEMVRDYQLQCITIQCEIMQPKSKKHEQHKLPQANLKAKSIDTRI